MDKQRDKEYTPLVAAVIVMVLPLVGLAVAFGLCAVVFSQLGGY